MTEAGGAPDGKSMTTGFEAAAAARDADLDAEEHGVAVTIAPASAEADAEDVVEVTIAAAAQETVERFFSFGATWSNSTFRSALGGAIKKVHTEVGDGLMPVEMQRPSLDLLAPPTADT